MDYKPEKFLLNNKLRLVIIPKKFQQKIGSVTIAILVNVGSNNETKNNNGISHFLEHLMFKGTKIRPNINVVSQLDKLGVSYNAMTGKEFTGYHVSGNSKDWKQMSDILIDIFCNSTFSKTAIEKERGVILEELNMGNNDPVETMLDKMHEKLFGHTSMGMSTIGTSKNIRSLKRSDFIKFKQQFYYPENSIMIVCGDIKSKPIKNYISNKFNKIGNIWKKQTISPDDSRILTCQIEQKKPFVYLKNLELQQTQVLLAFRTIPNERGLDILSDILTGGLSSRLFMALRQKLGATYSVNSGYIGYKNEGIFIIMYGIDNKRVYESVNEILRELRSLKKNIKSEEITKANKIRQNSFLLSMQSPVDVTFFYGLNELYNPISEFFKKYSNIGNIIYDNCNDITKSKLIELSRKTFIQENFNLFVFGNTNNIKKNMSQLKKSVQSL